MNSEAKPSKKYKEGGIYTELGYGTPFASKGLRFAKWIQVQYPKDIKVLCIGCGCGYEVVQWLKNGANAFGTELRKIDVPILNGRIINCIVPNLPFKDKEFDLMQCCEVIEHIEPELTDDFLKECKRVAKYCLFSIATTMDNWKTHINLHDAAWWLCKLEKYFYLKHFQYRPTIDIAIDGNSFMRYNYASGIVAHAS